jgi:hypothetical protein
LAVQQHNSKALDNHYNEDLWCKKNNTLNTKEAPHNPNQAGTSPSINFGLYLQKICDYPVWGLPNSSHWHLMFELQTEKWQIACAIIQLLRYKMT